MTMILIEGEENVRDKKIIREAKPKKDAVPETQKQGYKPPPHPPKQPKKPSSRLQKDIV